MRAIGFPLALALVACGGGGDEGSSSAIASPGEGLGPAFYEVGERGGLCIASDNSASMIVYDDDGANCMVEGRIDTASDGAMTLAPRGDEQCRIPIQDLGQSVRLGDGGNACAYYCGGAAEYAGRELVRNRDEAPDLRDAAGDALC